MSALEEDASPVLWIGNIGPQVTEDELREEFGEHGNILNLRILRDRYCAFITFEHVECAVAAKQALDSAIFGNQYIVINYRQVCMRACVVDLVVRRSWFAGCLRSCVHFGHRSVP